MRLTIQIDNIPHQIDTADPDLMARWIIEIFGRMREWTAATWVTMQAYPSFLPIDRNGRTDWVADWVADSAIIGRVVEIKSPRDLVTQLAKQLDEYEALPSEREPAAG